MAVSASPPAFRLPTELTRFVGRERELAELSALLDRARLVTLTGAAGSGKTRLALELAAARAAPGAATRDVRWVDLASLRDPALVVPAVAEAMGVREEVRGGDTTALVRLLAAHQSLLVVDNCEHLVETCAETAHALLRHCPGLSILATSREALGVPGERAWLVPPLSVPPALGDPDSHAAPDPEAFEAVRLFVERVVDVVPGFALTADNRDAVAEICRRLDGIPLAIELAAARVKVLSPAEIRDRLDDVFRILTSGGRTAVPRHRTLRAAIDWSHDLLPDDARALLRRLAVFRGGFGLDGAEAVGVGGAIAESDVLDLLARLVDRSLVGVREQQGAVRYFLLEAVRQYATGQLAAAGEEQATRACHARFVLARVEEAEPHLTRRERKLWVHRLALELDNIRSALAWSVDHDPHLHVRLVGKLWWFWFSTQHWTEGAQWIDRALALPAAEPPSGDRAALLFAAGALAALQVRSETARPALRECAELAARLGDDRLEAYALNYLGMTYAGEGREEAAELCARAEAWFREHDDLYGLRLACLLQGSLAMAQKRLDVAERMNEEGVRVARLSGQHREIAVSLQNLAVVHIVQGRLDDAEARIREALAALRRDPSHYFLATGLAYLGEIEGRRGRPEAAARLLGAAEALRDRIGAVAFRTDRARLDEQLPALRAAAGEAAFDRAWTEGRTVRPEALLEEILGSDRPAGEVATPVAMPDPGAAGHEPATGVPEVGAVAGDAPAPGAARPALRVELLGPLVVHVEGERLDEDRWRYGKPKELLAYLLLTPAGGTRDAIGEALWPGAPRSNVKNSFHVTLHHLRKALGHPEWVVVEGDRYRIDPELRVDLDADRFEAAARRLLRRRPDHDGAPGTAAPSHGRADPTDLRADLRTALALYRGDVLDGEVVGRWVEDHRDRLRRSFLDLSLALGAVLEAEEPATAADLYQRLAAREELDEEVHRRLMASWARAGDRVRALRHYDRVVELLREVLDAEPEPGTVALAEDIRAGAAV